MARTVLIENGFAGSNENFIATASVTLQANKLYELWLWSSQVTAANAAPPATIARSVRDFALMRSVVNTTIGFTLSVWRSLSTSVSETGTVGIDWGANTQNAARWVLIEMDVSDTSGTNGSGAVVQTYPTSDTTFPTTPGATFAGTLAAMGAGNTLSAGFGGVVAGATVPTATVDSGWTEDSDLGSTYAGAAGSLALQVQSRTSSDTTPGTTWSNASTYCGVIAVEYKTSAGAAPTLSAPTPSGTLGTVTTATLGATTDQNTGTLYGVVDTAANLVGITAAQIKAGQNKNGVAAVAAGSATVSSTSPSLGVSGMAGATGYSYAEVQNNANGDSNIATGTFTTAVPPPASQYLGNDLYL